MKPTAKAILRNVLSGRPKPGAIQRSRPTHPDGIQRVEPQIFIRLDSLTASDSLESSLTFPTAFSAARTTKIVPKMSMASFERGGRLPVLTRRARLSLQ